MLDKKDLEWLLSTIRGCNTLKGEDLGQAVITVNKLQDLFKKENKEKKNGTKTK